MMENRFRWFDYIEKRFIDYEVRIVYQIKRSRTIRCRGRPRKTIKEVIKKDVEINDLRRNMVIYITL